MVGRIRFGLCVPQKAASRPGHLEGALAIAFQGSAASRASRWNRRREGRFGSSVTKTARATVCDSEDCHCLWAYLVCTVVDLQFVAFSVRCWWHCRKERAMATIVKKKGKRGIRYRLRFAREASMRWSILRRSSSSEALGVEDRDGHRRGSDFPPPRPASTPSPSSSSVHQEHPRRQEGEARSDPDFNDLEESRSARRSRARSSALWSKTAQARQREGRSGGEKRKPGTVDRYLA